MKKILFVTEYFNQPYDEGIKLTAYNIFLELKRNFKVKVICRFGKSDDDIYVIKTNVLFISLKLSSFIKDFNPDILIYLPFQSATFASYIRLSILSFYLKTNRHIFISLQPKVLNEWQTLLIKLFKPKSSLTPSISLSNFWKKNNFNHKLIPLLTNINKFKPVSTEKKNQLRLKYKLNQNHFIISHMGHLNKGRNLESLISLQTKNNQIVIVLSSSTPLDANYQKSIKTNLQNYGIIFIDHYIENIEEIYQLSDLYVFPVINELSSIGIPLSILEARACSIPVLTTDYGSVSHFLGNDKKNIWYFDPKDFKDNLDIIKSSLNNKNDSSIKVLNQEFYSIINYEINNL